MIILTILLLLAGGTKHYVYPIKHELLWMVGLCVGGMLVEAAMVNIAQAWGYATPHILGIPIWMPIFWGIAGSIIIAIYDVTTHKTPKIPGV